MPAPIVYAIYVAGAWALRTIATRAVITRVAVGTVPRTIGTVTATEGALIGTGFVLAAKNATDSFKDKEIISCIICGTPAEVTAKPIVYNNESSEDEEGDENAEGENTPQELPNNPDDLLDDGYEETTDPRAPDHIRRFRNPETGDEVEFHEGKPDKPGWEGKDHWHRFNPNKSGKGDAMLDKNGNPVPKNSKPSHIDPNS